MREDLLDDDVGNVARPMWTASSRLPLPHPREAEQRRAYLLVLCVAACAGALWGLLDVLLP